MELGPVRDRDVTGCILGNGYIPGDAAGDHDKPSRFGNRCGMLRFVRTHYGGQFSPSGKLPDRCRKFRERFQSGSCLRYFRKVFSVILLFFVTSSKTSLNLLAFGLFKSSIMSFPVAGAGHVVIAPFSPVPGRKTGLPVQLEEGRHLCQ